MEPEQIQKKGLSLPVAILIAGILIGGAIVIKPLLENKKAVDGEKPVVQDLPKSFRTVSESDHIKGNKDAKITIVEFSDFQCPYCGIFHPTLVKVLEDYKDINWVYRHLPLVQIHPSAYPSAVASECVAKLGGNDNFWKFADELFKNQDKLDDKFYRTKAKELGVNEADFAKCLTDEEMAKKVNADIEEATSMGAQGTPFSLIILDNGQYIPVSGAYPYDQLKTIIDDAISSPGSIFGKIKGIFKK